MAKIKGILAGGVILLFLGLAISPVTSQTTIKDQLEVSTIGDLAPVQLSEKDLTTMEKFLPALLEKMQTATSYSGLIETVQNFMKEHGRQPILVLILTLLIKAINFQFKFNQFRPIRRNAFVLSWGYTNKFRSSAISMIRPISGWFYSAKSNTILNSRTIILDLYPFSIKIIDGRQIGIMTNFIGLYIYRYATLRDKAMTFFFGYVNTIRGFDLSLND
jgi:hypothetical protein